MNATPTTGHRGGDLDTRTEIAEFVERFYRDLMRDQRFDQHFAGIDIYIHRLVLTDFWCGILIEEDFNDDADTVIEQHRPLHAERPFDVALFERWLELFYQTLRAGWTGPKTTLARRRGHGTAWAMAHRLTGNNLRRDNG
jgi:truncated hemoglobin YjbI